MPPVVYNDAYWYLRDHYPSMQTHALINVVTFSNFHTLTYYNVPVKWAPDDARAIAYRPWQGASSCHYSSNAESYTHVQTNNK